MLACKPFAAPCSQRLRERSEPRARAVDIGGSRGCIAFLRCNSRPNDEATSRRKRNKRPIIDIHFHVPKGQVLKPMPLESHPHLEPAVSWLFDGRNLQVLRALVRAFALVVHPGAPLQEQQQQQQQHGEQLDKGGAAQQTRRGDSVHATAERILQQQQQEEERAARAAEEELRQQLAAERAAGAASIAAEAKLQQQLASCMEEQEALQAHAVQRKLQQQLEEQTASAARQAAAQAAPGKAQEKAAASSARVTSPHQGSEGQQLQQVGHIKPFWYFREKAFNTIRVIGKGSPEGVRYWLAENCKVHGVCCLGAQGNNSEMARRLMAAADNPRSQLVPPRA